MKRALMYASVASMIQQFNMENIRLLLEAGYEVDVACNMEQGSTITEEKIAAMRQTLEEMGVGIFHIPVPRKVTALGEIWRSLRISKRLMDERTYDLVHCHSPIGSIICRLANRFGKNYGKTKMVYTAHGFHFYRGAPKINWLMYYPAERICAHFTDVLITINKEDYDLAQKKMAVKEVVYVPGIGVDTKRFLDTQVDVAEKRCRLGLTQTDTVLLSVGELIDRKNHAAVIRALPKLGNQQVKYVICGRGVNEEKLKELADSLGVGGQVMLLGYRTDIAEIMQIADIYVFPSLQEGLPVALMEAMAAGRAVVCSDIRGNTDLIQNGVGGYLVPAGDDLQYARRLAQLIQDPQMREQMGRHNMQAAADIDRERVQPMMKEIYLGHPV